MNEARVGSAAAPARHLPALDGIRGLAIIWVVIHNSTDMTVAPAGGVFHLLGLLAHTGWIGVQLFFALSGFLISAGLLQTQGSAHYFTDFYAKRALRILPLYYTVLFALLIIAPRIPAIHWPFNTHGQASLWLFTINWTQSAPYGFAHFWSLAVEEQFYLLWPFVVYRLSPPRLLRVCLWIAVGALLLRGVMAGYGARSWTLYSATPCRMDALALGGAGACVLWIPELRDWMQCRTQRLLLLTLLVFMAGIPLTLVYNRDALAGETLGYTLLAACSATFVISVALSDPHRRSGVPAILAWAPLRSIGKYSYAMYVFHGLLHKLLGEPWLIARFGQQPPAPLVFVYALMVLLASYVLAYCSYHLLEKHFLGLRRLFDDRAAARASA